MQELMHVGYNLLRKHTLYYIMKLHVLGQRGPSIPSKLSCSAQMLREKSNFVLNFREIMWVGLF